MNKWNYLGFILVLVGVITMLWLRDSIGLWIVIAGTLLIFFVEDEAQDNMSYDEK